MIRYIWILIFLLMGYVNSNGQSVYVVKYPNEADIKVFEIVGHSNRADVIVYKVKYRHEIDRNAARWYFTKNRNEADIMIYYVQYQSQADLNVMFTTRRNESRWRTTYKKNLIN